MVKPPLGVPALGGRAAGRGLRHSDNHLLTKVPAKDGAGSLPSFKHLHLYVRLAKPIATRSRLFVGHITLRTAMGPGRPEKRRDRLLRSQAQAATSLKQF